MTFLSSFSMGRCCIFGFRYNLFTSGNKKLTRYLLANVKPTENQFTFAAATYCRLTAENPKDVERANTSNGLADNFSLFDEENVKGFNDFLSTIVLDLNEYFIENNIPEYSQCMENMLIYSTLGGKKFRGMAASFIYQKLMAGKSEEVTRTSYVLGWCIEILQASFLLLDDLIDGSTTRRGMPCWYTLEGKGLHTANDTRIMEHVAYFLITKYFRNEPFFGDMISIVHQVVFSTTLGQALDLQTGGSLSCGAKQKVITQERYKSIVQLKTSYYTLVLPAFLALSATENTAKVHLKLAKEILLDIGHLFQAQDDFLDCFGNEKITGKFGTDIAAGKCTWFAVRALELARPAQRLQLTNHYGKGLGIDGENSVNVIKDIYTELNLEAEFKKFERESHDKVHIKIQKVAPENRFIFTTLLEFLFKRNV